MSNLLLPRRAFLAGLAASFAAPAIVRAASLMPIRVERLIISQYLFIDGGGVWHRSSLGLINQEVISKLGEWQGLRFRLGLPSRG